MNYIKQLWTGVLTSVLFKKRKDRILKSFIKTRDDLKFLIEEQKIYSKELEENIKALNAEKETIDNETNSINNIIEKLEDFLK